MQRRRLIAALAACGMLAAGCSSVIDGRGSVTPGTSSSASTGGSFPSTTPATTLPPTTQSSAPAPRPGALESPDGDFSVVLPPGWSDGTDQYASGIVRTAYLGPAAHGFAANVNVTREAVGAMDVEQFHQATLAGLRAALHVTDVSEPTPSEVDGENALEYTFQDVQAGRALKQRQTIVIYDGNGYVITYTGLRISYDHGLSDADAIIGSWQWG